MVGVDLFIVDVMRSRDCGSAPYISYFLPCFSKTIKTWKDLKPYFDKENYKILRRLYKEPCDIELLIGMLWEKRSANLMGKISGCLVGKQFNRFKFGDRFFHSTCSGPNKFLKGLLLIKSIF